MKNRTFVFTLALVVLGASAQRTHAADEHVHDAHASHASGDAVLPPPAGRLWPIDEPLRAAMTNIRSAVEAATPAYERKTLKPADATAAAALVEEGVAYMVANCRLAPEPDATLHVLIGRMMSAASALKHDPGSSSGVPALRAVLHDYQSTFDHPGWSAHAHWSAS